MTLAPPIGYFGSKVRVAPRIVDLLPKHDGYIEPYCGSLTILLAKPPTGFEVVNDLDQDLMTFWRVLRDQPDDLERVCALTPHSRGEYQASWPIPDGIDDLERARRVWVKLTQGRGGALRSTGWRFHEAPEGRTSTMPRTLRSYVDRMPAVVRRLAQVTLECRPAIDVIERYGRSETSLIYVDPPYLFDTRARSGIYAHEMGDEASHRELAEALMECRAAVAISGYPSPLYDELYDGWHRAEIAAGTGQCVGKGYQERTEVLWCNRPLRRDQPLWEITA